MNDLLEYSLYFSVWITIMAGYYLHWYLPLTCLTLVTIIAIVYIGVITIKIRKYKKKYGI